MEVAQILASCNKVEELFRFFDVDGGRWRLLAVRKNIRTQCVVKAECVDCGKDSLFSWLMFVVGVLRCQTCGRVLAVNGAVRGEVISRVYGGDSRR